MEEALYDSRAMREFVGIDLGREPAPDESTICNFRHLLEAHELGPQILATVNAYLAQKGFKVTTGTIVDATIISAPSSTKNQDGQRDPRCIRPRRATSGTSDEGAYRGGQCDQDHPFGRGHDGKRARLASAARAAARQETQVWGDSAYRDRGRSSAHWRPRPRTSPTAAIAVPGRSTQSSGAEPLQVARPGQGRACVPYAKRVFGLPRCAVAASPARRRLNVACALVNLFELRDACCVHRGTYRCDLMNARLQRFRPHARRPRSASHSAVLRS